MKVEFEKKMRMGSDLLAYCHTRGAKHFTLDINIDVANRQSVILCKANPVTVSQDELARARKLLSAPRSWEIESKYWGLSGESESYSELMLVGMMSDEAKVEFEGDTLSITLVRKVG